MLGLTNGDNTEYRELFRQLDYVKGSLTPEAKVWFYFMNSRLVPSKHVSTLYKERVVLFYAIMNYFEFNVGTIIEQSILEVDLGRYLRHPSLITSLCREEGIVIAKDEEECPTMVPISFPRQRRPKASTSTTETSREPLKHMNASDDEDNDDDDSESILEAT